MTVQEVYLHFKALLERIDLAKDNPRLIQETVAEAKHKLDELLMPDKPAAAAPAPAQAPQAHATAPAHAPAQAPQAVKK